MSDVSNLGLGYRVNDDGTLTTGKRPSRIIMDDDEDEDASILGHDYGEGPASSYPSRINNDDGMSSVNFIRSKPGMADDDEGDAVEIQDSAGSPDTSFFITRVANAQDLSSAKPRADSCDGEDACVNEPSVIREQPQDQRGVPLKSAMKQNHKRKLNVKIEFPIDTPERMKSQLKDKCKL